MVVREGERREKGRERERAGERDGEREKGREREMGTNVPTKGRKKPMPS